MRRSVMLLVVMLGAGLAVPAYADPEADRERVAAQLAEAGAVLEGATDRAREAAQQHAAATAQLPAAQAAAAEARGIAAAASADSEAARREADQARGVYQRATAAYEQAAKEVTDARTQVATFASAVHQGGGVLTVNTLLAARDPRELTHRLEYLDQIARHNSTALSRVTSARMTARVKQNDADVARQAAEGKEKVAAEKLAVAQRAERDADNRAAVAQQLVEKQQQAMRIANEEKDASLARYAELQAESQRLEQLLREIAATPVAQPVPEAPAAAPPAPSGAYFPMPVRNAWKSSDFGSRFDPFYHVWQLHAGVDFAASGGEPIYAVADGRVVQAGWNGGYGKYTCVAHGQYDGRGLATCYAHQSTILVDHGQNVRAGQVIGRIGTTGASTGDHLHFEVRLNGAPVQPLDFLPPCLC